MYVCNVYTYIHIYMEGDGSSDEKQRVENMRTRRERRRLSPSRFITSRPVLLGGLSLLSPFLPIRIYPETCPGPCLTFSAKYQRFMQHCTREDAAADRKLNV